MSGTSGSVRKNDEISIRKFIQKMNNDFNESLMLISNKDMSEYEILRKMSIEKFLIRYKLFIDDIETANEETRKLKAQSINRKR